MNEATWKIWPQDCITGIRERLAPESVHLTVTSIPFEELFSYSGKVEDVGNNGSTIDPRTGRFALNMRFVVDSLLWAHAPGTNVCVHIQQLLAYKVQHGFMGRRDFRGAMVDVFTAGGFVWIGEAVIPKNQQSMAKRLNLHSLQFKTGYARSGTNLAPAPNDHVLIFQKPGEVSIPVRCIKKATNNPNGWVRTDEWVQWASGDWNDVMEIDVLDGARFKETDQEKHVCPLQLEIIRRCVLLYSNPVSVQPDVLILDPFMGIGSTAWVCLGGASPVTKAKIAETRNVVGFELKESYHKIAEKNCAKAEKRAKRADKTLLGI